MSKRVTLSHTILILWASAQKVCSKIFWAFNHLNVKIVWLQSQRPSHHSWVFHSRLIIIFVYQFVLSFFFNL